MVSEHRSLQDLIRGRQQGDFVGRQGQVVQYRENLAYPLDDTRRRFLFNIHGDAGVGKTYLTKQLQQIANQGGALTAYIDETSNDVTAVMDVIAEQLGREGILLKGFQRGAASYRQRRHELETDPNAPDGLATFLTKTAVTIGLHAARDVPIAGSVLAPVDPVMAAEQINKARVYVARKFRNQADVRLLLSPTEELTKVFVADLNHVTAGRSIALFFDTYERTASFLDRWLRDLYAGRYGDLPIGLITTISGQLPLNPNFWGAYLPVIADVALEPFTDTEARQFLASKGISDVSTIEVIMTLSGRLPMWLETLAEGRPENATNIGDPADNAVERFLKWEENADRRAVAITAALPRTLNQDVLSIIVDAGKAAELFGWLRSLPFVTRQAQSWAYHEVVRVAMLRLQRARSPNEWRNNHIALAQANAQWATEAAGSDDQADQTWSNPRWVSYTQEEIYHALCADSTRNLDRALSFAVDAARGGAARARQWAEIFSDAGRDTDNRDLLERGKCLAAGIRDADLASYFAILIDEGHLEVSTLIIALQERGQHHANGGRFEEALADLNRAIELDATSVDIIGFRGETYRRMNRYEQALTDFNRTIEIAPKDFRGFGARGQLYRLMGRYEEALTDLRRAIEFKPDEDLIFNSRGETYRLMGRHEEALADFNRAIELNPDNDWAIGSRGQTYQAMGRYEEALADFNRAIELDADDDWSVADRGETYRLMGRYEEALADFNRAIELDPENVWAVADRGETYQAMDRYEEALADFSRAIELDPENSWAVVDRGEAYRQMHRFEEALADFNRAIELDPESSWAVVDRSRTYRGMGRFEEALADLNRVIQLNTKNASAVAHRGETYRLMGRYEEALADFNCAIELDPDYGWAIGSRGQTYRGMGRFEEALADFNRAIELDPENDWAVADRGEAYRQTGRFEEALTDLNRAIELDPEYALAIYRRGRTYEAMGRQDQAYTDLNRAAELKPGLTDESHE